MVVTARFQLRPNIPLFILYETCIDALRRFSLRHPRVSQGAGRSSVPLAETSIVIYFHVFCMFFRKWQRQRRWSDWLTCPATQDHTKSASMKAARAEVGRAARNWWMTPATWEHTRMLGPTMAKWRQKNNSIQPQIPPVCVCVCVWTHSVEGTGCPVPLEKPEG